MLYTGFFRFGRHSYQSIGAARSDDLMQWDKILTPYGKLLIAASHPDPRWYEKYGQSEWPDEVWRSPALANDPSDGLWHLYTVGRTNHGPTADRTVVGHAIQTGGHWQGRPPLATAGYKLGATDTLQIITNGNQQHLLAAGFSAIGSTVTTRLVTDRNGQLMELRLERRYGTDRSPPVNIITSPLPIEWENFHPVATLPFEP